MNRSIRSVSAVLGLLACAANGPAAWADQDVARIPHLDHVFVIVMENHGYTEIVNNPNAPFLNKLARESGMATNYYGVGHPSLTNYLEIVGGSNFGNRSDNAPDWHDAGCIANLQSGLVVTDNPASPPVCPIAGTGMDAATPAIDYTNETSGPPGELDIDGTASYPAAQTVGQTIADQLVAAGLTWKSYQEDLPAQGADRVNVSDGTYTNLTDFGTIQPALNPPLAQSDIVALYAVKHNPFAYFRAVQEGWNPRLSMAQMAGFDGARGLYADLASGNVPTYSFIAPNQCHDQHGQGNGGAFCNWDPNDNGTQAGLNPALVQEGDASVQKIVTAIKASRAWHEGRSAIAIVWDENDYAVAPIDNRVLTIIDTNYLDHPVQSNVRYTHFSLLKTIEAGLGLPCLNHACDASAALMEDLFAANHRDGE